MKERRKEETIIIRNKHIITENREPLSCGAKRKLHTIQFSPAFTSSVVYSIIDFAETTLSY
jgi:hypothetical protein